MREILQYNKENLVITAENDARVVSTTFVSCYSSENGGAILCSDDSLNLNVITCSFFDCRAAKHGGNVYAKSKCYLRCCSSFNSKASEVGANLMTLSLLSMYYCGFSFSQSKAFPFYFDKSAKIRTLNESNAESNGQGACLTDYETINIIHATFDNCTYKSGCSFEVYYGKESSVSFTNFIRIVTTASSAYFYFTGRGAEIEFANCMMDLNNYYGFLMFYYPEGTEIIKIVNCNFKSSFTTLEQCITVNVAFNAPVNYILYDNEYKCNLYTCKTTKKKIIDYSILLVSTSITNSSWKI